MLDRMNVDDTARSGSVDLWTPDQFIDAQYRKTELRNLYRDKDTADRVGKLMRTIEQDVIPRLVSGHRRPGTPQPPARMQRRIEAGDVTQLADILLGHAQDGDVAEFIASIRADGVSVEQIYLHLLAPAARHVGALWDDDRCTFVDVTLALGTLHRILLTLSADFSREHRRIDPARRILLAQLAGGQHTFGLRMVAEFFKRGAWTVDTASSQSNDALADLVAAEWFTVVGFSVACEADLGRLAAAIRMVRAASRNAAVGILVGGQAFLCHSELVRHVGADAMAADAIHAVLEAEGFVLKAA